MPTPQAGIFALGTRTHHHLEFDVNGSVRPALIGAAVAALNEQIVGSGGSNVVVGFGPDLWRGLSDSVPADLGSFAEITGCDGHIAPSTQHDLWIWIHGTGVDDVLDLATAATSILEGVATLAAESRCFVYHDSRDLTGFIDGTENPPPTAAVSVACIADGAPGAGGSHVIAQRWVHDLAAFDELNVADQELVIGRRKVDSAALPKEILPTDAHVSRAELLDEDGHERPIYRRSLPFGDVTERGLFFVGFSAERDRFNGMLAQMYGTASDGLRDRLLDFSTPVTGSYYFAPCVEDLLDAAADQR
ncbi:MAG: Dyp-type peroxidase [Ilumatobacteraceae bacterium]|nr:Dyp-type peroxidase [Ilumatobacteraceae bacterium]